MDLSRKRERQRLPIRREPYWTRLTKGAALGFRRGPDTWVLRYTHRATGKSKYSALEEPNLDFDEARQKAESELSRLTGAPVEAAMFIQTIEKRQGLKVCCPEEIAYCAGCIDAARLEELAAKLAKSGYGEYLLEVLRGED